MAEEGSSSPLSSVLSSPPASPPRSVSGDWNALHAQEVDTAARVALKEIAAEESTVEEPAVKEPAVKEPAVKEPAVEEPTVEELVVKKPATKKPAAKKPAVEQGYVKESEVQGPEEPEEEPATALAAPSACPENKTEFRPSDQLEARQPEEKGSTSWAAINLPPQKLRPVNESEVPTREEDPTAPTAAPSSVPKKRKSLPGAVSPEENVADSRNILKPKLTRGACTPCRENKLKCLKEKPICSRCSGSGTHCVYAFEQPRKGVSAAARPALSKAEAVPADVGEPKALSPPNAHADSAVQDLEIENEIATPAIEAATVTDSINGQGPKGPKNEDPSTVTKRARKRASGQTSEEAVLNNDAWSSKVTRHSGSSDEQLGTELGKRKASDQDKSSTAKRPRHAGEAPKKTNLDRKWGAPFVYTDEKSPLTNADLRAILLLPRAWDVLTPDERKDILAKFSDDSHILDPGTEIARPDLVSLRNNDHFRYDCARYLENIERGRHDEQWLQEAWVAHEKHKRGDYDDFLIKEFENDWATKIPEELLQKTSRKNETLETDATVAVSENKAIAKKQRKALPGRTKSASVIQEIPPSDAASVVMAETNTSHIANHHPNGHEESNTNGARYTELRFEVPHEVD